VGFRAGAGGRTLAQALQAAQKQGRVAALYLETPANPTNALIDIAACAEAASRLATGGAKRPPVIVDNTFLGPLWQQPLAQGADLVIYSLTKYVGGHSDVIAGACLGTEEHLAGVRGMRTILGTMCDPHTGWLLMRSLETLKLRMTGAMKTARYVAEFLADHPKIKQVHYLGFLSDKDPDFEIYRRQCKAPGSTFSFEVHGGEPEAFRLLDHLRLIRLAVSLGGTESLAEHPGAMTHAGIPPDRQADLGISPAMIRLSVGVEHPEDLIADLAQALEAV
jgi:methionine-gamma-lyase